MKANVNKWFNERILIDPNSGCWNWTGLTLRGKWKYGRFVHKQKCYLAHRYSYENHIGKIPEGMFVCHKCDNPKCVNPEHLFVGTAQDNMDDMVRKGRNNTCRFEQHGMSKLKIEDVIKIREMFSIGNKKRSELAKEYKVTWTTIDHIVKEKIWRTNAPR